jgi:hypothetical protein
MNFCLQWKLLVFITYSLDGICERLRNPHEAEEYEVPRNIESTDPFTQATIECQDECQIESNALTSTAFPTELHTPNTNWLK